MIKRPSKNDNENEILRMQQEFYAEQNRDTNFQPAAKVVRVQRDGNEEKPAGIARQSEFAKRRALRVEAQTAPPPEQMEKITPEVLSDECESPATEEPPRESLVMGEVIERRPENTFLESAAMLDGSFPKTMHITAYPSQEQADVSGSGKGTRKSLFAQMVAKGKVHGKAPEQTKHESKISFEEPAGSALLEGWDATEIHNENMRKLNQMSVDEICKERDNLLNTLDPKLVEFLKSRKKADTKTEVTSQNQSVKNDRFPSTSALRVGMDVLREKGSEQWINFDVLEPEKLEWTKDIERSVEKLKPGETYEARFDWKGVLQPYTTETIAQPADDRELYLHGEDAQRPGYTLQELFRLARSNVLQQRISALAAIAGMLNIMNQGFYDGVVELPISKVFFFLRFALDENTPSVVEVASRALASLFYNDTDEILLDTIFDSEYGMVQPELALDITHSHEEEQRQRESQMQAGFDAMNLAGSSTSRATTRQPAKPRFKANLPDPDDPDDVHNRETMNDFHLAETDLVECLLRTNILERIRYILFAMKPEGATVINCTKILIRLARTSERIALKIATNEPLIGALVKSYLTLIDSSVEHQPQHVVLKLVRVLCGYRGNFYEQHLHRFHVVSLVKRYVFSRKDINVEMIQIQIESFRFFRLLLQYKHDDVLYSDLWPALCYLLEWHYQHLIFAEDGPFIIRQHAVALLALIGHGLQRDATAPGGAAAQLQHQLCDKLFACFSKWFTAAQRDGANEFSQKLLLAGCLWSASRARSIVGEAVFRTFLERYVVTFVRCERFNEIMRMLSSSSLILAPFEDRTPYAIAALPTLGAVQLRKHETVPTLIVTRSYPVFLLQALLHLLLVELQSSPGCPVVMVLKNELFGGTPHRRYLEALCARAKNPGNVSCLGGNWFTQTIEQRYLLAVLQLLGLVAGVGKNRCKQTTGEPVKELPSDPDADGARTMALKLAITMTFSISEAFYRVLLQLFDDIIFVAGYYGTAGSELAVTEADLQRWKLNYKLLAQRAIKNEVNLDSTFPSLCGFTVTEWKAPLLGRSWPYSPLYLLVDKLEKGSPKLELLNESAIISTGLRFSELVEASGVTVASATERVMYLMAAFLGPDSKFLEPDLSGLIERRIAHERNLARTTQTVVRDVGFDFETTKIEGRKSYYGLYQLALDVFQSSSYGHSGFGSLLMVPLAQKYDVRWRNMVWSEYVAVLRFITCSEAELFADLNEYLEPAESDTLLLRSYGQALNSNLLRPGSIPHRVAAHHLQAHRSKTNVLPRPGEKSAKDDVVE
ncbi:uncharacterized protein LOC128720859 [Anopheles nili]|uniref:uncharacterized protein LOC128720859 n=1 Tax=Anopheles nili TaxID=185578 RepID=UPI00237C504B|nr:uncharacterized protein LOC128720859 [Anopheles nili]